MPGKECKADMESSTALSANPGTQSAHRAESFEAALWAARNHNSRNAALNCGDGILFVVPDNHRAELIHKKRNFVTAITELWCNRHYA